MRFKIYFIVTLIFVVSFINAQSLTNGLLAHYTFNAGSTIDNSGNSYNPSTVTCTPTTDRHGNSNYAMDFDGINDYIYVPFMNEFHNEDISICLWFKTSSTDMSRLIALPYSGCPSWSLLYRNPGSTPNGIDFYTGHNIPSAYYPYFAGEDVAPDDEWHFVVGMRDSINKRVYLYLDCNLIDSSNYLGHPYAPNEGVNIGRYNNSYGQYFEGSIDDIRIYNRKLSVAEINLLCNEANPLTIEKNNASLMNLTIYPNPGTDFVNLNWNGLTPENYYLQVNDVSGKFIAIIPGTSNTINISSITQGIYFVNVISKENQSVISVIKFIKE